MAAPRKYPRVKAWLQDNELTFDWLRSEYDPSFIADFEQLLTGESGDSPITGTHERQLAELTTVAHALNGGGTSTFVRELAPGHYQIVAKLAGRVLVSHPLADRREASRVSEALAYLT